MDSDNLICDKCGIEIPKGNTYVCLNRSIEFMTHNVATNEDEIETIDSEQILTLCTSCGNKFDSDILVNLLKAIPLDRSQVSDN